MRRTRTGMTAVALISAGSILLTACGSDSGDDQIEGADQGGGSTETAEPEDEPEDDPAEPEDGGIDRPDVTLPDYMENDFAPADTEDATELAIIHDAQQRRNGIDLAIDQSDLEHEALEFYSKGDGLIASIEYIANAMDYGTTWTGTVPFYNWQVEIGDEDGTASVAYCRDENAMFEMDPENGEVTEREPSNQGFIQVRERVELSETGVWQRVYVSSERGTEECVS